MDINYKENRLVAAEWECENGTGQRFKADPMLICMRAGILPVLNTNYAKDHAYFKNQQAYLLKNVLMMQKQTRYEDQRRVWVVLDEIADLFKQGNHQNLMEVFSQIFVQGRGQNIGCLYSTTSFEMLPEHVKQNTTTLICTQMASTKKSRDAVKAAFRLEPSEANQLADLNVKKREVMVMQKDPFVVIDRDGNRKVGKRMYRGFLIAPNCATYYPKLAKQELSDDELAEQD